MKRSIRTGSEDVYCISDVPIRPKQDLRKPRLREHKLYCWHYWINMILDPNSTRIVLDELDTIPVFSAGWGSSPTSIKKNKQNYRNLYK